MRIIIEVIISYSYLCNTACNFPFTNFCRWWWWR